MPLPTTEETALSTALPKLPKDGRSYVVVVGAGVVGLSAALWLQRRACGRDHRSGAVPLPGASYLNAASLRQCLHHSTWRLHTGRNAGHSVRRTRHALEAEQPAVHLLGRLAAASARLVDFLRASSKTEFDRIVGVLGRLMRLAEAGHNPLFEEAQATHLKKSHGCLYLYRSSASFPARSARYRTASARSVRMEILDRKAVKEREPHLAPLYSNGLLFSDASDRRCDAIRSVAGGIVSEEGRQVPEEPCAGYRSG